MQEKGSVCLAEGVTLSGVDFQQRLQTDSAPEKSPLFFKRAKDAEGVKPERVNLSGKRTEVTVGTIGYYFNFGVFVFAKTPFFYSLGLCDSSNCFHTELGGIFYELYGVAYRFQQ